MAADTRVPIWWAVGGEQAAEGLGDMAWDMERGSVGHQRGASTATCGEDGKVKSGR